MIEIEVIPRAWSWIMSETPNAAVGQLGTFAQINVRLPVTTLDEIRRLCGIHGIRTMTQFVRQAVVFYVDHLRGEAQIRAEVEARVRREAAERQAAARRIEGEVRRDVAPVRGLPASPVIPASPPLGAPLASVPARSAAPPPPAPAGPYGRPVLFAPPPDLPDDAPTS